MRNSFYVQLFVRNIASKSGLEGFSQEESVPPLPSWIGVFEEFHCRGCSATEAYRSRPRGFFEKRVLPFLLMQTVRCQRCDQRAWVFWTITALERNPPGRTQSESQRPRDSKSDSRVA